MSWLAETAPSPEMLIVRILIGTVLGAVIGYERDRHRRNVGLRTHMIVALAAATFMVVSIFFREYQVLRDDLGMEVDVSRIAASVVSGIGFLAGGAILRTGLTIQGLTTAAGLWLVTAIGMAAGSGMFLVAAAATITGVVILTFMRSFEARIGDTVRHRAEVSLIGEPEPLFQALTDVGATYDRLDYEKTIRDQLVEVTFDLEAPSTFSISQISRVIERVPGVKRVRLR